MNVVDLAVFVTVLSLGVRGLRRGFFTEALEAVSALGGVSVALIMAPSAGLWITHYTGLPLTLTRLLSFVAIAVFLTAIGFFLIGRAEQRRQHPEKMAFYQGLYGFIFGAAKGLLYSGLVIISLSGVYSGWITDLLDGSAYGKLVLGLAPLVYNYFPKQP